MTDKKLMDRVVMHYQCVWPDALYEERPVDVICLVLKDFEFCDLLYSKDNLCDSPIGFYNLNWKKLTPICNKKEFYAHIESFFNKVPDAVTHLGIDTKEYINLIPRPVKPVPVEESKAGWVPKVGEECEISNCGNDFTWCKPKFIGDKIIVVDHLHGEQHYHLGSFRFRKIKPEREKFISKSWALVALPCANYDHYAELFGKQYDDGARFMDDK